MDSTSRTTGSLPARRSHQRVVAPHFGRMLAELRGKQSRAAICHELARGYGLRCDPKTLASYEAGEVASPDPAVLWALSRIYQLRSSDDLMMALMRDRTGRKPHKGQLAAPRFTARQLALLDGYATLPLEMQRSVEMLLQGLTIKLPQEAANE